MTDCKNVADQIFDYIDGLLPIESRKLLNKHIAQCPDCSEILDAGKAVRAQLRGLRPIRTSADFETVLRTRISMERSLKRRSFLNRPIRVPIYAAVGVLGVIVALFVARTSGKPGDSPTGARSTSTIPSSQYSANISRQNNRTTGSQKVVYPIEWVNTQESTNISSNRGDTDVPATADSVREFAPGSRIQPVGVEF